MLYIIHGANPASSRAQISNIQKKHNLASKIEVAIEDTSAKELQRLWLQTDIFGQSPLVVLDIYNQGRMNVDEYVTILQKLPKKVVVIVYAAKELSKANKFINTCHLLFTYYSFEVPSARKTSGSMYKHSSATFPAKSFIFALKYI